MRRSFAWKSSAVTKYDVAVIGGGTVGCLVAGRLGMENVRTLLLEEGEDIRRRPKWHRDIPCSLLAHRFARRNYESHENITAPQKTHRAGPGAGGAGNGTGSGPGAGTGAGAGAGDGAAREPVMIPTPRVLGGGGVMGGRSWNLGDEKDWDGGPWSFRDELLPRVQKLENLEVFAPHRGRRGKFLITRSQALSPYFKVFCEAMSKDTALTSEFNKKDYHVRSSCGRAETFVDQRSGTAHTTLQSYLMETVTLKRPVQIQCNARVLGIGAADDKTKATGVSYKKADGEVVHVEADAVILCAGGIGSPRLLAVSQGSLSVDPSVGTNFWDKPQVTLQFRTRLPLSHNCFMNPLVQTLLGLNMKWSKPIHALRSAYDDMICYWSSTEREDPDVKFIFQPFTLNNDGLVPDGIEHGIQIIAQLVRPKSRGCIKADGTIDPQYLTHPDDEEALRRAVARLKELSKMPPLSSAIVDMVAERFESAGIYGGASYPIFDKETFLVKGTQNVYVCDESILPTPLIGDSLPYMLALGETFADQFLGKPGSSFRRNTANDEKANEARIIY